jgi:gamma-glutamyltranspeptidase/glutathione hydrolase
VEDPRYVDGVATAGTVHRAAEAAKLAFADREAWYGDSAPVPLDDLLSEDYTSGRRALVDPASASFELRPGSPCGAVPRLPRPLDPDALTAGAGAGEPTVPRPTVQPPTVQPPTVQQSGDTVHVDVVDRWGNLVSATPSGGWLQSSPVVPGLGFPLGTRAQMFWLEQGLPASLVPGVRPRTTLSPSLALRDGRPWMAFGTPGGDQQDQWQLVFLLRAAHGPSGADQALQALVDAPMLHSDHAPSSFYPRQAVPGRLVLEDRWPASTLDGLRRLGHDVSVVDGWSLGRLSAVTRDGEWLRAAANPRGAQGYAVGR